MNVKGLMDSRRNNIRTQQAIGYISLLISIPIINPKERLRKRLRASQNVRAA
jgi:hypothetical protein